MDVQPLFDQQRAIPSMGIPIDTTVTTPRLSTHAPKSLSTGSICEFYYTKQCLNR